MSSASGRLAPTFLISLSLGLAAGCKPPSGDAGGDAKAGADAKDSKDGKDAKDGADAKGDAKAVVAGPCGDLSSKLCEKSGDQSSTCTSMKALAEVLPAASCTAALSDFASIETKLGEQRKSCDELQTKLCTDLGAETESCKMVKEQTPTFPPDRCKSMLERYADVLGELKKREERNKPLSPELQAQIAGDKAPAFGPADAKVTIVEFSDFQCPYCSRAADVAKKIKEKYSDKVRFVFRQFPLSFHQDAHLAAQASLVANDEGKFWPFHDALFANQKALTRADLEKYAKEAGMDLGKLKKALDDGAHKAAVDADIELGGKVFVDGTPTMFINGARVENPTDFDVVSKQIDTLLAG